MNARDRIKLVMQSVAIGVTSVENGTNNVIMIFGDVLDGARVKTLESLGQERSTPESH